MTRVSCSCFIFGRMCGQECSYIRVQYVCTRMYSMCMHFVLCVCVCVCVYIYIYICMYIYIYIYIYIIFTCMHTPMTYIHGSQYQEGIFVYIYLCKHAYIHTYIHTCLVCLCGCTRMLLHTSVYTDVTTYIRVHGCYYIHVQHVCTLTYSMYIHTYVLGLLVWKKNIICMTVVYV
jgi:hypothetical protein